MQSILCMLGQHSVFESATHVLKSLLRLDVSAKQIQRVSEWYGNQIDPIIEANHQRYIPQLRQSKKDEYTYVMMDGSTLYTREEDWKEIKVGRIFHQSQNIGIQENRNQISHSLYVSHLGDIDGFFPKLERHLANIKSKKIFISDGAKWIWKWNDDNFPGSIQILDYYHAVEKIETFARLYFKKEDQKVLWMTNQKELLLNDQVLQVIKNVEEFRCRTEDQKKAKKTVISYYTEHEDRMMYKTFKKNGWLIGSGPIESAHRNLVQQRLKLSGQRWSKKGAQSIVNLRAYNLSKSWNLIEDLIKLAA